MFVKDLGNIDMGFEVRLDQAQDIALRRVSTIFERSPADQLKQILEIALGSSEVKADNAGGGSSGT